MILLLILALFIPMFGAPDPHNLTRFAGPLIILAVFEIIAEVVFINVLINKPGGIPRTKLRHAEKVIVKRKVSKKTR